MRRRQQFVYLQVGGTLATFAGLAMFQLLTRKLAFIFALLWFLVLVQFTEPMFTTPPWRSRLRSIALVGLLVFLTIAVWEFWRSIPLGGL